MAGKIIERQRYCKHCNKITKHHRKINKLYIAIQIFLFIVTGGLWAMMWLAPIIDDSISIPFSEPWVCQECKNKK